jgi:hypothetical protein
LLEYAGDALRNGNNLTSPPEATEKKSIEWNWFGLLLGDLGGCFILFPFLVVRHDDSEVESSSFRWRV